MKSKIYKLFEDLSSKILSRFDNIDKKVDKVQNYMFEISNQLINNEQEIFETYDQIFDKLSLIENKIDKLILKMEINDKISSTDSLRINVKQ